MYRLTGFEAMGTIEQCIRYDVMSSHDDSKLPDLSNLTLNPEELVKSALEIAKCSPIGEGPLQSKELAQNGPLLPAFIFNPHLIKETFNQIADEWIDDDQHDRVVGFLTTTLLQSARTFHSQNGLNFKVSAFELLDVARIINNRRYDENRWSVADTAVAHTYAAFGDIPRSVMETRKISSPIARVSSLILIASQAIENDASNDIEFIPEVMDEAEDLLDLVRSEETTIDFTPSDYHAYLKQIAILRARSGIDSHEAVHTAMKIKYRRKRDATLNEIFGIIHPNPNDTQEELEGWPNKGISLRDKLNPYKTDRPIHPVADELIRIAETVEKIPDIYASKVHDLITKDIVEKVGVNSGSIRRAFALAGKVESPLYRGRTYLAIAKAITQSEDDELTEEYFIGAIRGAAESAEEEEFFDSSHALRDTVKEVLRNKKLSLRLAWKVAKMMEKHKNKREIEFTQQLIASEYISRIMSGKGNRDL